MPDYLWLFAKGFLFMTLPKDFLESLEGVPGFDKDAFVQVHEEAAAPTSIRLNPAKAEYAIGNEQLATISAGIVETNNKLPVANCLLPIADSSPVPWCAAGYYLLKRPSFTFDPLFHAGCYYVQEASSMFLEQAFKQLLNIEQPLKVLDLCAAPGGKSTHIQSLISKESLLVCNEVIKPRSAILTDNIIKWGCANVFVTNNDPKAFQQLRSYFDVMVVDAPCSGSGLFRRDEDAIQEWSLSAVQLCSQRQQRILADALPALKEEGILIYSTCSYSQQEDECIMDWLVEEWGFENLPLDVTGFEGIVQTTSSKTGASGYRFYPDKIKGEGFFLSCFRKKSGDEAKKTRLIKPATISVKEKAILQPWLNTDELSFFSFRDGIIAVAEKLVPDFALLNSVLNLQYAGVAIGAVLKEKLVPNHALAQSLILSGDAPRIELNYDDAIKYLQRQDIGSQVAKPGWNLACYKGHPLGWINALPSRINNYYPKELRILKAQNTTVKK